MKIGIVCYPSVGGSGVIATELGHALAAVGHEIHFITYEVPFRLQLDQWNIFFHEVAINQYELFKYPDYALALAVKIVQVAVEHKLDILHVHYAIPHATSAYLAKQIIKRDRPIVITTLHGTDITLVGVDRSYFDVVKFSIENSDGVTAVSKSLKRETIKYFGIKRPIEVIYNFFEPNRNLIGQKPLRNYFVKKNEKLLVHASNYRSVKRADDVVRIFREVSKRVKSKMLFLGSGSGLESVKLLVKKYDLDNKVFFLGKNSYVDPYVASSDLFLLPSAEESFGLSALEAMAYGIPVVATKVGGLSELIDSGVNGYLAPFGDIATMTEQASELLENESHYKKVSAAARKKAGSFTLEKILPKYLEFYHKMLA